MTVKSSEFEKGLYGNQKTREAVTIAEAYLAARKKTAQLVAHLSEADCTAQSMTDASPVKWHLAHTSWFFEVFVLEKFERHFVAFDPTFRMLFNSYYNGVGEKFPRAIRGLITRPGLSDVLSYRENIDRRVLALLETESLTSQQALEAIVLGINHEQQHQELILTDVKHLLSLNPLLPSFKAGWPLVTAALSPTSWRGFEEGLVEIGSTVLNGIGNAQESFCFDNELPRHKIFIAPFELATQPLSYGDVIDFIEDKGYDRAALWLSMGWEQVQVKGWQSPMYWQRLDNDPKGEWLTFTLRGLAPVSRNVPVPHLSYFEADAIARWKGARLPTEAEWELAAEEQVTLFGLVNANLLESDLLHPLALQQVARENEICQLFGDVWEWTQSSYSPYPGFRSAEGAVGEYNGKFMCGQFVLKGGSCFTPQSHIRASYRNFFPPDARWQCSGVRLAKDI
jgi:ergothioneine biosynthesis protein EgtB